MAPFRLINQLYNRYFRNPEEPSPIDRRHSDGQDQRTPFQRDRDRILYTDHFNRLSGVTQVARTGESYLYHDRQTHSLKVAQVGQRLTQHLLNVADEDLLKEYREPNPNIVETAALAHDLGHPPFGHAAENELDRCVREEGVDEGFEANAQSFRIVTKLATHRPRYEGLDLTRASLNAILKYPWARGENEDKPQKWGYYRSESADFDFARECTHHQERSIEAEIMDWADDVAYAVHDMDDFYRSGLLPLDRILSGGAERDAFIGYLEKETKLANDVDPGAFLEFLGNWSTKELEKPYSGTPKQTAHLNQFTSHLINRYLGYPDQENGIMLREADTQEKLTLDVYPVIDYEIKVLKELTKYYIINDSSLMSQQHGQRKVVNRLFKYLVEQSLPDAEYKGIIPSPYRDIIEDLQEIGTKKERVRIVVDMITRLTEQQTLQLYERLEGTSPGSLQDRILR